MGTDIHSLAQRRVDGRWETIPNLSAFDWRSYGMFGFLANVRNMSQVPPISEPRGLPDDVGPDDDVYTGDHSKSWLSVAELTAFNYDARFEDRRVMKQLSPTAWTGGHTAEPGGGETKTIREFLGEEFFAELEKLKAAGVERIVFGFDS